MVRTASRALTLLLIAAAASGRSPIRLTVYPTVSPAPATVEIRLEIEPAAANRSFDLLIEGDSYVTQTSRQLNGLEAPRRWRLAYRDLPAGDYDVVVVVRKDSGTAEARASFLVS